MSHDGDGDSNSPANDGDGEALQEGSPTPAQALKGDSPLLDQEKSGIDPTSSPAKTGVISTFSEVVSNVVPLPVEETGFVIKDGIAELAIPVELMEERNPLWKCFIAGYFMNDAPHIGSIHATVNRIWALQGKNNRIDVQFIGKTTVLFRIEDAGVRSRVLKRKFWHIGDFPLMVGEWNPETASAPPDLSAMPLWVDLLNVPGYLYSERGLRFLARTSGKFIKLHPNTQHCIRMDVARLLVEVDLTKPLPNKISFKGKDGEDVLVSVSYLWLPPRCVSCSKWGHVGKDCKFVKERQVK